jgi:hypothetical protein
LPTGKYAILYQNDDLGKDYVNAFKTFLGGDFDKRVVMAAYEVTEPTIDSQVVTLKSSGADALLVAGRRSLPPRRSGGPPRSAGSRR